MPMVGISRDYAIVQMPTFMKTVKKSKGGEQYLIILHEQQDEAVRK
jgi:hypothetical protein